MPRTGKITRDWWESRGAQFDLYVSEPVLEEAAAGDTILSKRRLETLADIPVLALTERILKLAESLVSEGRFHLRPPAIWAAGI